MSATATTRRRASWSALLLIVAPGLGQAPVDPAAVARIVADLDAAFTRGDVEGYLGRFRAENPELHRLLELCLRRTLAVEPRLQRRSEVCDELHTHGDAVVAVVRSEFHRGDDPVPVARETWLLVVRASGQGAVPVLAVEAHEQLLGHVKGGVFACEPCNYHVGAEGWLPVPLSPDRAHTMEAVSFYLLGSDVACDISVHLDPAAQPAATSARELADGILRLVPDARMSVLEPWLPPTLEGQAPAAFTGARVRVDLPDGNRCIVHVDALGPLRHVLLLRGSAAALTERSADVQRLLASYHIHTLDASAAELAARPLLAHTGGTLRGADYSNPRHRLSCSGPADWSARRRAGGFLFRVAWTCPDNQGRMWLTGYAPPASLVRWTRDRAEQWLADLRAAAGLEEAERGNWQEPAVPGGFWQLSCTLRTANTDPEAPDRRLVRLCVRDDLLAVLDGHLPPGMEPGVLRAAFDSLKSQ